MRSFRTGGAESWSQLSRSFQRRLEWRTVLDENKKVTTPKSLLKKYWKIVCKRNQSQKEGVGAKSAGGQRCLGACGHNQIAVAVWNDRSPCLSRMW